MVKVVGCLNYTTATTIVMMMLMVMVKIIMMMVMIVIIMIKIKIIVVVVSEVLVVVIVVMIMIIVTAMITLNNINRKNPCSYNYTNCVSCVRFCDVTTARGSRCWQPYLSQV